MTTKPVKTPRVPKYKTRIKVLDNNALQGVCSCGWNGNAASMVKGVSAAMAVVQQEIQAHKHIPKERKNAKKKPQAPQTA